MVEHTSNTSDPHALRWLAAAIAIHPDPLDDYGDLVARMEHSMLLEREAIGPSMRFFAGIMQARTGQYGEASAVFEAVQQHVEETGIQPIFPMLANTLLLALCQAKLGNVTAASGLLETANEGVRNSGSRPWHIGISLELLYAEAEAAVASLATQEDP